MLPDLSCFTQPSIVRLRRFDVEDFQGRIQLQLSPGFSWAFFNKDSSSFAPEHKSHENTAADLTLDEKHKIMQLRDWVNSEEFTSTVFEKGSSIDPVGVLPHSDNIIIHETKKFNKYFDGFMQFSDIKKNMFFDILGRVIASKRSSDCIILRCVDGTKPGIDSFKNNSLYMESTLSQITIAQLYDYYLDISIYDTHILTASAANYGDFVQLRNVHCYIPSAKTLPEVILHKGFQFNRGMRILPLDHDLIHAIKERIDAIPLFSCTDYTPIDPPPPLPSTSPATTYPDLPPLPATSTVTACTHPDLPLTSILDIIQAGKQKYLYRVRVFVDSYSPDNFPSFILPVCVSCQTFCLPRSFECSSCGALELVPELFFSFQVRDLYDGITADLRCVAVHARKLLRISEDSKLSVGELEVVEEMVGKWCDLNVVLADHNVLVIMQTAML